MEADAKALNFIGAENHYEQNLSYIGKHAWMAKIPDTRPIPKAIFTNDGANISMVYVYQKKELGVTLESSDGINYSGTYETDNYEEGRCSFTLYKNDKGCFLYGSYDSKTDGHGLWLIQLEKSDYNKASHE